MESCCNLPFGNEAERSGSYNHFANVTRVDSVFGLCEHQQSVHVKTWRERDNIKYDHFLVLMQYTDNLGGFPWGKRAAIVWRLTQLFFPLCTVCLFPYHRLWGLLFYDRWIFGFFYVHMIFVHACTDEGGTGTGESTLTRIDSEQMKNGPSPCPDWELNPCHWIKEKREWPTGHTLLFRNNQSLNLWFYVCLHQGNIRHTKNNPKNKQTNKKTTHPFIFFATILLKL